MMIRGIRGATTFEEDNEFDVISSTKQLVEQLINQNEIEPANVASVFISATTDLTSTFPAKTLRQFSGWKYVPVMCMQELAVPGGLSQCVRIMIHYNTDKEQDEIKHVYLKKAVSLRPDLNE
jgi:chorismate mutase